MAKIDAQAFSSTADQEDVVLGRVREGEMALVARAFWLVIEMFSKSSNRTFWRGRVVAA